MNAILFDLDGTLTDPREDKRELLAHLLPHHGIAPGNCVMVGDRVVPNGADRRTKLMSTARQPH